MTIVPKGVSGQSGQSGPAVWLLTVSNVIRVSEICMLRIYSQLLVSYRSHSIGRGTPAGRDRRGVDVVLVAAVGRIRVG